MFYHIPALENGPMTFGQLRAFLRQNGWEEWTAGLPTFEQETASFDFESFGARILLVLLEKVLWKQIECKYTKYKQPGVVAEVDADKLMLVSQPSSPNDDAIVSNSIVSL